jgi:predicted DNA-binding WGR domain protein
VRFGKVGTEGQTQTKTFSNEAECQKQAEKLIAEKIKKGYVEGASPVVLIPQHPSLKK